MLRSFSTSVVAATLAGAAFAQITPGNLVVTRVGDGSGTLTSASAAVFLDEYTAAGAFVQSIAMPTAASGLNLPISNSGSATSEGSITQSTDGRYLITVGYAAAPGTTGVVATASATTARVVARIALDGTVDTSTGLSDAYSASNIRGACSIDGEQFWTAGTATAANGPGVRYVSALGATTSTQLSTSVINIRRVEIVGGQLYCGAASGAFVGVNQVGTGLPTMSGETITLLPGFPLTSSSPYDFFFADAATLYVTDDRTNGNGGIQKWTESGGTWTLQYVLAPSATVGCRGLSGYVDNGAVTLFATATDNTLVSVVDTGVASTFTVLTTGATNTALRGVRWVRTPASATSSGTGCASSVGIPTIGTNGAPVTGNLSFALTAGNAPVPSFVLFALRGSAVSPFGIPIPGAPACALLYALPDVLLVELADPSGNAAASLPLPPNALLGGSVLGAQVLVWDFSLVGFSLPLGTSDALDLVVGN